MVVTRDYMLKKPSRPSFIKTYFDITIIPMAVNFAGMSEVALNRASARTGVRPGLIIAGAAALAIAGISVCRASLTTFRLKHQWKAR